MRQAEFDGAGSMIRWTEAPGAEPARVYVHGLGSVSSVYHAHIAARPGVVGRRSLFVDLPGHGISDRPADFGYTLEEHADAVARALDEAELTGAELVAHSMGGAVAIVLAHRRPDLVSRLVLAEPNLDPLPPVSAGSSIIGSFDEEAFVDGGHARVLLQAGPVWPATLRLTDPRALHRSAVALRRGTRPTMRDMLVRLPVDRLCLQGELSGELPSRSGLEEAGVRVVSVPDAGHNIMFDNPGMFAAAVAGTL
ncbi:alpha/beta fold hydrolase [Streptomyces sp. NPDC003703]|uniref:alpha/beta fold hydrolase n=1 Tax=Streptomyces sp. NPDC003283 TaxID=3364681 RepID=UPI003689C4DC